MNACESTAFFAQCCRSYPKDNGSVSYYNAHAIVGTYKPKGFSMIHCLFE